MHTKKQVFYVPVFFVKDPKFRKNHKNRYVLIKENKIGMPFNIVVASPSSNVPLGKVQD